MKKLSDSAPISGTGGVPTPSVQVRLLDFAENFAKWVDWTRHNLPDTGLIPSISISDLEFPVPWMVAQFGWLLDNPEADLLGRVFHAVEASGGDITTRFTALHLYYHLREAAKRVGGPDCVLFMDYGPDDELVGHALQCHLWLQRTRG